MFNLYVLFVYNRNQCLSGLFFEKSRSTEVGRCNDEDEEYGFRREVKLLPSEPLDPLRHPGTSVWWCWGNSRGPDPRVLNQKRSLSKHQCNWGFHGRSPDTFLYPNVLKCLRTTSVSVFGRVRVATKKENKGNRGNGY